MGYYSLPMQLLRLRHQGADLSERERQVLRRIALGDTQLQAAERLGVKHETIRTHTKKIRAKLGAKTNAHAVAIAISLDLI